MKTISFLYQSNDLDIQNILFYYYLLFFNSYTKGLKRIPDPVSATFHPGGHYGLLSEEMDSSIDNYLNSR